MTHPDNFQCFIKCYRDNLLKALGLYPQEYPWPESQIDQVMQRMTIAIERGSFNKDSHAFKMTCKELKIKHTYKDIKNFISL